MSTNRSPRSDGLRNRAALFEAAAKAFAEQGENTSIAEIARRAGVGKATVFRHFPTKEDLLTAVVMDSLDVLIEAGERLRTEANSEAALYSFLLLGSAKKQQRGLSFMQDTYPQHHVIGRSRSRVMALMNTLLERARADGVVRGDVDSTDVVMLMCAPSYLASHLPDPDENLHERFLSIIFDGLRPAGATPLTVKSPTARWHTKEAGSPTQ